MSTEARDKAWDEWATEYAGARLNMTKHETAAFYGGFDAGRASVRSGLTVERIAKALYVSDGDDPNPADWSDEDDVLREVYRGNARAVLALIEQETKGTNHG